MWGGLALTPQAKPLLFMFQILVAVGEAAMEGDSDLVLDPGWATAHVPGTELSDVIHYMLESGSAGTGSEV